ncbi:MAG: DUF3325 family protein [Pseudomonadota bacterium]
MELLLAFVVALLGAVLLSLSMRKHIRQWRPGTELSGSTVIVMRVTAYAALAASAVILVRSSGWGVGLTMYCGVLTVAAFAVAMANSIRGAGQEKGRRRRA